MVEILDRIIDQATDEWIADREQGRPSIHPYGNLNREGRKAQMDQFEILQTHFEVNNPRRRVVPLDQNTDEWLEWRASKMTASEAPVIMDACPSWYNVKSWEELRLKKVGLGDDPDEFTKRSWQHGAEREDRVRRLFFESYDPICIEYKPQRESDAVFGASLDGVSVVVGGDDNVIQWVDWCEIKCPSSGFRSTMYKRAMEQRSPRLQIQDHTWWQLVHQAAVLGSMARSCFVAIYIDDDNHKIVEVPVDMLMEDWDALEPEWERFYNGHRQGGADANWDAAAREWLDAKVVADDATKNLKQARDVLEHLADGATREAGGVKASFVTTKGAVDWQTVATELWKLVDKAHPYETLDEFSEAYRKDPSTSFRVAKSRRK